MLSEFWINYRKFQDLSDKAVDWLIKSWTYEADSYEQQICILKYKMFVKKSLDHLIEANKHI